MIEPQIRPRPGQSVASLSSPRQRMQRTLGIQLARKRLNALGMPRAVPATMKEELLESTPIRETRDNRSNETSQPSLLFRPGQQDDTSTPDNNSNDHSGNGAIEDYSISIRTPYCNIAFLND